MVQEIKALLIWHAWKSIVRILSLEINYQFRELMVVAKVLYRVLECLPADNGRKMPIWLAVATKKQWVWLENEEFLEYLHYSQYLYSISKTFRHNGVNTGYSKEGRTNPSLKISCPALVQPEMLPWSTGNKVAAPAMRKFMCDDINVFAILMWLPVRDTHIQRKREGLVYCTGFHTLEIMLGVANVKTGFSMPPYGKLGGKTNTLYSPQM